MKYFSESKNLKQLKTVFKDTQKVYEGKEKTALITYVQKQHNVFESDKKLGDGGVKHFIISAIAPDSYEQLTPAQKKTLEQESINWSKNTFEKFGFIGALEYNQDKSDVKYPAFENTKKGFHIHMAVSDKYIIRGSGDLLSLRESLANHLSNTIDGDMRTVLGVKSKEEMETFRRESISKKQKQNALENLKNNPDFLENNQAIQELNNDLSKVFNVLGVKHELKNDLISMNKHERYNILNKKTELKNEMGSIKRDIKGRQNEMKFIDQFIKGEKEKITAVEELFQSEYKELQSFYKKQMMGFSYWADGEHGWFKKIKNDQLKNKEITTSEFLAQVAQNKSYWQWTKSDERKRHQFILKQKRADFKKKLFEIGNIIRHYGRDRLFVASIVSMDKNKLDKKLAQYSDIGTKYNNHYEVFLKRIEQIGKEIGIVKAQKLELSKTKQSKLDKKRTMIQKILAFDATVGGKGFEALEKGVQQKYQIEVSHGKQSKTKSSNTDKKIHIEDTKSPSAFDDLIRGVVRITSIRENHILKTLKTSSLLKVVRQSVYSAYPQFKQALQSSKTVEDFIAMFDSLKSMAKSKPKVEESYFPSL